MSLFGTGTLQNNRTHVITCHLPTEPATISLSSSPTFPPPPPPPPPPITAGASRTLNCSVTLPAGVTGTPDFQWEGPGVTPTPTSPTTSGQDVSSVLTLSAIAISQAGQYSCTATLSGSVSTTLNVTVQSKLTAINCLLRVNATIPPQSQSPPHPSLPVLVLVLCMLELHLV